MRIALTSETLARLHDWAGQYDRAVRSGDPSLLLGLGSEIWTWLDGSSWASGWATETGDRTLDIAVEDPLLSAVLGAEAVNGIQGEDVISTLKHYSLNCNETNRHWLDAIIDPVGHRESDLLAFQIAIERSQPGSGGPGLRLGYLDDVTGAKLEWGR